MYELNNEMMELVNGGDLLMVPYHKDCGGRIANYFNPFLDCRCEKCGETHYYIKDFAYTMKLHLC